MFTAMRDSLGLPLSPTCTYQVEGPDPSVATVDAPHGAATVLTSWSRVPQRVPRFIR